VLGSCKIDQDLNKYEKVHFWPIDLFFPLATVGLGDSCFLIDLPVPLLRRPAGATAWGGSLAPLWEEAA
jgi:hypothetical protein